MSITGVLTDEFGEPVSNVDLEVIVDGKTYNVKTNSNGHWVLSFTPIHTGKVIISVISNGDLINFGSENITNFNVKGENKTTPNNTDNNKTIPNSNDHEKTIKNSVVGASMKKTGIVIIAIILLLLSSLGLINRKK